MAYLTIEEMVTHIYPENADAITRENDDIITEAIETAIDDAKSYLADYDLLKIFGDEDTEPVVQNKALKSKVKDLAAWELIRLGAPNIQVPILQYNYEAAIRWFEKVAKGDISPQLPMPEDDPATDYKENAKIQVFSEPKRNNNAF